jgi:hypothetical protein
VESATLGIDGGEEVRSTRGAYVALHLESMRMMVESAKLGALNLESMAVRMEVRSTKYEVREART